MGESYAVNLRLIFFSSFVHHRISRYIRYGSHVIKITSDDDTEQPHDKTNNVAVRPAKTQISLGIRPV